MPYQRTQTQPGPPTPIHADLYPAKITTPQGTTLHDPIKALIGLDTLWLYTINGNTGTLTATYPIDHLTGTLQHGYTIHTNNTTLTITRSSNCGCGNNKTWRPFPYRLVMTPIPRK